MRKLPAPGTDPYNYRGHTGVDVCRGPSWNGKPFYASGPGVVLRLSKNAAGGCWIVVRYDGINKEIGYAHMNNHNGCPRPGTRIGLGTRLGYVGSKGTRVNGPHIHLEALGIGTPAAIYDVFDFTRKVGSSVRHIIVSRSVKEVQKAVGANQDGIWGPETLAKVKAFQKKHGLVVDGIWGKASDAKAFPSKPTPPKGNDTLRAIQAKLNMVGYNLKTDGILGPATRSAIRDFQQRNGLKVDGIWGNKSEAKFKAVLAKVRPVLRRNSRGTAVRTVQAKVGVKVDGIYGPATQAAVVAFQKKHGLVADGIVGVQTWLKLGV